MFLLGTVLINQEKQQCDSEIIDVQATMFNQCTDQMNECSINLSECQLTLTEALTNGESSDCSDVEQQVNQLQITLSIYEQQNEDLDIQLKNCQNSLTLTSSTVITTESPSATTTGSVEEERECFDVT